MIKFSLRCENGHVFESWFKSGGAYDDLDARNLLVCPVCGSSSIAKEIMSPQIRTQGARRPKEQASPPNLAEPGSRLEKAVAELRKLVEKSSEYVGQKFVSEARAIHIGDAPKRSIFGEARLEEARDLLEEGVPIAPLPWQSPDKTH